MDGKKSTAPVDTAKQQPHQHNAPIRLLQYGKPPGQYPLLSHPHQHQYYPQYNRPGYNPLNQQQIWVPHQPPVHYHQQQPQPKAEAPKPAPQRPRDAERKKGGQQLRSPVAKRPPQAPVTMQGWLHKQGSEGLMLWKKRWFVLSEYCLFYYKGAEEEKLLGSILLPSYRVSVCGPEDKVNRKYAFKCEHDNMRTYILAADSQELMTKWVQLLNAACLLQNPCDLVPQQGHQEYSIHTHSSSNVSSPSQQELTQYTPQPLYANAPPKPRRLNGNFPPDAPTLRYIRPIYTQDVYMRKRPEIVPQAPRYNYNTERRTPDTYGRSKHYPGDYEDIYTEQMYKRPVSPLAAYTTQTRRTVPTLPQLQRTHLEITIPQPRPHSADFLEYEISRQRPQRQQQPRPKSSLDINRNVPNDSYFYSEQRYAENMRKSAQYLQVRKPEQDRTIPLSRSNTQPLRFEPPDGPRCRSVLSEGSLSKELDEDAAMAQTAPHRQIPREYDQFTRSASARMAHNERGEGLAISREGEKKREESMKRLLEWKQRMLQSPLNRKVSQGGVRNVDYLGRVQMSVPEKTAAAAAASSSSFSQYNSYSSDDEASGSISLNPRKSYPRKNMWYPPQNRSNPNFAKIHESNFKSGLRNPVGHHVTTQQNFDLSKGSNQSNSGMNVSAGELLGRTHEELVLLLIQLRRQSTNTCHAIEACYNEIDSIQAQLHLMDQAKRLENLQKLEQIKQHLLELEKQYEKGKPLVNLVDNMVKLGSLYRSPADRYNPYVRDKLEFNQSIQERRLLTEEKRDWNRLKSNHTHLQEKVQELYQLDRLIQEESGTLRGLQRDKEEIEHALGDLRRRINEGLSDPAEMEQARRQQMALENELSRVHSMLAENSKKLEETVAGNARLEQKLLLLKQKLQVARQQRSSPQFSNQGDSLACFGGNSSILESDLQRVQQRVGDLQRQRQELSMKVRQLMDRSNNLQNQIRLSSKRKVQSVWRETDLDTMSIVDHGESHSPSVPLYINTDLKQVAEGQMKSSDSTSDEMLHNSKQEIKTVRIVKRESERRHRDREKTVGNKWDLVLEEDDSSQSSVLFCPSQPVQKAQSTTMISETAFDSVSLPRVYSDGRLTSSTEESLDKSELSPVFKSEAARQIITEMSIQETPKLLNRRVVPKEKRRHYTAPHNNLIMKSLNQLPTEESSFDKSMDKRARDDLDMERALRQRIDAPDVVRSTLSNTELKYNENTIDTILGTPNKIRIPERYIPEQLPQLSAEEQEHRLRKVESIKKMLSGTIVPSSNTANFDDKGTEKTETNLLANKATSKMIEEKKQREHLLQLNQILAKQVMEMSKIVAVKALAALPLQQQQPSTDEEDLSPVTPLPLYQQRDNFYS